MKVKPVEPEGILAPHIGGDLAAAVIASRSGRQKPFDSYRAVQTLNVFLRASDPRLSAWEYVHRKANQKVLTAEYLRACVNYDPQTGHFSARLPSCKRNEGDRLGAEGSHGYLGINIAGRSYLAHRLAWLYVHGCWPPEQIDHIDRDRKNNRLENLRPCTNQQNNWNKRPATGHDGVSWCASRGRWRARITVDAKGKSIGYFEDLSEALAARRIAEERVRGRFLGEAS